jgi:transcriptional regulator with XRE-family HTH domain
LPNKHWFDSLVVVDLRFGDAPVDWDEETIKALYVEIGGRVRRARKQRGWSQEDLANTVRLTRSSIANLEAGRQRPPVHITLLISQALDVPVDTLLPTAADLDELLKLQSPALDLEGQPISTHDFVNSAMRRVTGGRP